MIPAQFKVDIFEEIDRICTFKYEIIIFEKVFEELEALKKKLKGEKKTFYSNKTRG